MNRSHPEDAPAMKVIGKESIFTSLKQDGPFSCEESVSCAHPFSREVKNWVRDHCREQIDVTKYRSVRNQIFEFLDIQSFRDIQTLIDSEEERDKRQKRSKMLLGNMFGIEGNVREIEGKLSDYARTANDVIIYLRSKILAPFSSHIETTNEIQITSNPLDLLLIVFNDRYHKKARFEAKRKLTLMNLAALIDQRERETGIEDKFSRFLTFLNEYVWSPSMKIGELEIAYLVSSHEPRFFSCTGVEVISEDQLQAAEHIPGRKITLIKRRRFRSRDRDYPIYVTIRKKTPEAKVLKLLRKNEKNPAVAVDDELGLMAVLNTINDVKQFQRHLTNSALKIDSFMTLEDISDTLTGKEYQSSAVGSSTRTQMLKFFARLGGIRVEFILHTNKSYLNYIYQRDVSHDEYEVKRIFDTGVAMLLFPSDIYRLDHRNLREKQLRRFRRLIEDY
ncbi:hypothetical protein [Desulfopila inferna]|uniref:hypothetical protein n=1 Tax=Desulfopila inferna TaxID=468528 RepID=UPI001F06DBFD|nr:hypothetical protein [Desulfopila inferna]